MKLTHKKKRTQAAKQRRAQKEQRKQYVAKIWRKLTRNIAQNFVDLALTGDIKPNKD